MTFKTAMETLNWKNRSGPYTVQYMEDGADSGCDLETSVFLEEHAIRRTIIYSGKNSKHSSSDDQCYPVELSTDHSSPGVLKIFGGTIVPGVEYKSVLASCRSTAPELVKQALERYDLSATVYEEYVLCDVVGRTNGGTSKAIVANSKSKQSPRWQRMCSRILADTDRPLFLQKFWRPSDGFCRRYELRRRSDVIDSMGEDDTYGLNENARKISISKLRPGAIPFFVPWTQNIERFRDDYDIEGNLSLSNSWTRNKNEQNNLMRSLSFDVKGHVSKTIGLPNKTGSDHVLAPISRPFLLTLRGYDVNKDSLFYILEGKTTLICSLEGVVVNTPCMTLSAPDISPQHCYIHLKRSSYSNLTGPLHHNYCIEIECHLSSNIRVNGAAVVGRTTLQAGDILSIGTYYVFLFKDFTAGNDIPLDLPWLSSAEDVIEESVKRKPNNVKPQQNIVHVPPLMLGSAADDNLSICTMESQGTEVQREKFRFAYSREKEEELVSAISAVVRLDQTNFVLAPAYLYSMCIQFSCVRFDSYQIRNLLLRILAAVKESVAAIAKALKGNKFNSGLVRSRRHPSVSEDFLREMLQWIANCVQIILYLRGNNYRVSRTGVVRGSSHDNDIQTAFRDLATGLEEIVFFCFQQTIYTITKALYLLLPVLLDGNPFSDDAGYRHGVGKVIGVLDSVAGLAVSLHLHSDVIKQLFMYIFFFCSTSVFNRLFLRDAAEQYYNWTSGVRIRANLGQIEEWATRNNLEEEFGNLFERLMTVAEFLSSPKTLLEKYDWLTVKKHFQPLNEAQLYRLLSGYNKNHGHSMPNNWLPTPEDRELASREDEVMLDLSGHPAFLLPTDGCVIDLMHPPDAGQFWALFKQLYEQFGLSEDESDIGISPANTPRFTGNFPKVELQKSFFCQSSTSMRSRTMSPSRKVQFMSETDSSTQSTPRERKSHGDQLSGSSERTDINKNVPPQKPKRNLLKSNNSPRSAESPDKRLDMLIGSAVSTSPTNNETPNHPKLDLNDGSDASTHRGPNADHRGQQEKIQNRTPSPESQPTVKTPAETPRTLSPPPVPPRQPIQTEEMPSGPRQSHMSSSNPQERKNVGVEDSTFHPDNEQRADNNGNDQEEVDELFSKDLLLSVNKQIIEAQKLHSEQSIVSAHARSPTSTITEERFDMSTSSRLSSNPVFSVNVRKGDQGLGLGLIDGLYTPLRLAGIYIRKVLPDSPAALSGSLHVGDRLLCVNGKSIVGADYQSAMRLIKASGENLTLLVAKGNRSIAGKIASTNC